MAVVRIDDKLLKEIKSILEKDGNGYVYPSVSAFVNMALYEKITATNKDKQKK